MTKTKTSGYWPDTEPEPAIRKWTKPCATPPYGTVQLHHAKALDRGWAYCPHTHELAYVSHDDERGTRPLPAVSAADLAANMEAYAAEYHARMAHTTHTTHTTGHTK